MLQLEEPSVQKGSPHDTTAKTVSTWSGRAREEAVQGMFTAIARFYDLNNSVLSFGLHHRWKQLAASHVPIIMEAGRALDVGAGTGDLAVLVAPRMGVRGRVVATDLNYAMLREGTRKIATRSLSHCITCLRMNAEDLGFPDGSFDAVTTGFCMRNVGNLMKALREIYRVMKPRGTFVCLEFSQPVRPWLLRLYDWYSFKLLPRVGTLVASDTTGVYHYLPASIRTFPNQKRLCELLCEAGFRHVTYKNLTGGIVAIHIATK